MGGMVLVRDRVWDGNRHEGGSESQRGVSSRVDSFSVVAVAPGLWDGYYVEFYHIIQSQCKVDVP